jgi:hypothetical protein
MRPALLLLVGVGRFTVPLPYFPVWMLLFPLAVLAGAAGYAGRALGIGGASRPLSQAPRMWLMACCLHGLSVNVRSDDGGIRFSFV